MQTNMFLHKRLLSPSLCLVHAHAFTNSWKMITLMFCIETQYFINIVMVLITIYREICMNLEPSTRLFTLWMFVLLPRVKVRPSPIRTSEIQPMYSTYHTISFPPTSIHGPISETVIISSQTPLVQIPALGGEVWQDSEAVATAISVRTRHCPQNTSSREFKISESRDMKLATKITLNHLEWRFEWRRVAGVRSDRNVCDINALKWRQKPWLMIPNCIEFFLV